MNSDFFPLFKTHIFIESFHCSNLNIWDHYICFSDCLNWSNFNEGKLSERKKLNLFLFLSFSFPLWSTNLSNPHFFIKHSLFKSSKISTMASFETQCWGIVDVYLLIGKKITVTMRCSLVFQIANWEHKMHTVYWIQSAQLFSSCETTLGRVSWASSHEDSEMWFAIHLGDHSNGRHSMRGTWTSPRKSHDSHYWDRRLAACGADIVAHNDNLAYRTSVCFHICV